MKITSTLAQIAEQVFRVTDVNLAKDLFVEHVRQTKIKEEDKKKMIIEMAKQTHINGVHRYMANALLKYEGLGTGEKKSEKKLEALD